MRLSGLSNGMDGCCSTTRIAPYLNSPDEPGSQFNMGENNFTSSQAPAKESLFTNFEDVQLTDEERVFLNAAALGDVPIVRQSMEDTDANLNINCVDYMGRSALHLAVDCDSMEMVELLMEKICFECIEESLLHAISKGATKIVKVIIEHPNYMAGEELYKKTLKDPFFRTDEKSQFSPDITPLILAAHYNNHEIIQMFLYRNQCIEKPHEIACQCSDCVTKQNYDSLKRSRSRLHAYRALASPAYMALSSPDPIMTTFQLRQEMKKLAQVEKEFKNEYLSLVEQCMNFACELMDLCRGTQEVEAVLSESNDDHGTYNPLERLKMAMEYEEKKFVAHPNCQQHLTSIWYGAEMGFMQSLCLWKKIVMWIACVPLVPIFCIIYLVSPETKVANVLRCPAAKFITHTVSNICFLILLTAATFRLDERTHPITSIPDLFDKEKVYDDDERMAEEVETALKHQFRPANLLITNVQLCLVFFVLGQLWMEYKQIHATGLRVYLLDNYNLIDFSVLSLYLASYVLRFLVDHWIKTADVQYNGTARVREALSTRNSTAYLQITNEIFNDRNTYSYFMKASRFKWMPDDPEIVSDILFAIANVLSIARTTYLMPAFEVLGTLQISLGRMLADITRFLVLFTLVLFAFMVGLHNLYWYYGSQTYEVVRDTEIKLVHTSEAFQGLPRTLYSLFWCMFGQISIDSIEIKYPEKELERGGGGAVPNNHQSQRHATSVVEGVGMFLFALYHVAIIIVLINMLIAMMSHSFEAIQGDCDVEWKFARTRLWMNYIDEGNTLPVPFNLLPALKDGKYVWSRLRQFCRKDGNQLMENDPPKKTSFILSRREKVLKSLNISISVTSNADMLQRLVRRYLFKLERLKEEGKEGAGGGGETNLLAGTTAETYISPDDRPPEPQYAEDNDDGGERIVKQAQQPGSTTAKSRLQQKLSAAAANRRAQQPQIHLLSLPQLDAIQRTLKILDVRLQHVQSHVRDDEQQKQDIEHIRRLMSENQVALASVVTVLASIQEEVGVLRNLFSRQQANTFQIQPPGASSSISASAAASSSATNAIIAPRQPRNSRAAAVIDAPPSGRTRDAAAPKERKTSSIYHIQPS